MPSILGLGNLLSNTQAAQPINAPVSSLYGGLQVTATPPAHTSSINPVQAQAAAPIIGWSNIQSPELTQQAHQFSTMAAQLLKGFQPTQVAVPIAPVSNPSGASSFTDLINNQMAQNASAQNQNAITMQNLTLLAGETNAQNNAILGAQTAVQGASLANMFSQFLNYAGQSNAALENLTGQTLFNIQGTQVPNQPVNLPSLNPGIVGYA